MREATKKNLALLLITEAITNINKSILNVPADIVINLNGIGVKPAVNTIQKFHCSYKACILLKPSSVIPGTYLKKVFAKYEYSTPGIFHHNNFPI